MSIKVYGAKAIRKELSGVIRDVRVTWLLEELKLPYERIVLDPQKGENKSTEYLKLNPTGKVPTLADGDFTLFESGAICEYLAEKYGKFIAPSGTPDNFVCRQWCYFALTNVEPQVLRVFACDYFYEQNETTAAIRKMALETLPRFLKVLDQKFEKDQYLVGKDLTIADILLTTTLGYIRHTQILSDYPALKKYLDNCQRRPAFKIAFERNGREN